MKGLLLVAFVFTTLISSAFAQVKIGPGDVVMTELPNYGRVEAIHGDQAIVHFFESERTKNFALSELAKVVGCSGRICVGTPLISRAGHKGIVQGIFLDGSVNVLFFKLKLVERGSLQHFRKL